MYAMAAYMDLGLPALKGSVAFYQIFQQTSAMCIYKICKKFNNLDLLQMFNAHLGEFDDLTQTFAKITLAPVQIFDH